MNCWRSLYPCDVRGGSQAAVNAGAAPRLLYLPQPTSQWLERCSGWGQVRTHARSNNDDPIHLAARSPVTAIMKTLTRSTPFNSPELVVAPAPRGATWRLDLKMRRTQPEQILSAMPR